MNKKVLYTLEYNKITEQLSSYASSDWAKEHCIHLKPITDKAKIEQAQAETAAALSRIYRKGSLSFGGIHKIGMSLKRLEIGGILSIEELLHIASLLETAKRVKTYGRNDRDNIPCRYAGRHVYVHRTADSSLRRNPALYYFRRRDCR